MKRPALVLLLLAGACGDDGGPALGDSGDAGTSAASSGPSTSSTTTGSAMTSGSSGTRGSDEDTTSGPPWETEGADDTLATTSGCGFTCPPPGGGPQGGCDIFGDDCPDGERCMPWANDGGELWNATRCSPRADEPAGPDEACAFEFSPASGFDTCDDGLWCRPRTLATLEDDVGECVALCNGGSNQCAAGELCVPQGRAPVGRCSAPCDPFDIASCAETEGCWPVGPSFGCAIRLGGGPQGEGRCQLDAQCGSGSLCTADGNCAAYCNLDAPNCEDGQTCVSAGSPLAAYANVGYCDPSM
ncbi:MAG: hypothetical protein AAGA54_33290 [Myxococcota bacterium]